MTHACVCVCVCVPQSQGHRGDIYPTPRLTYGRDTSKRHPWTHPYASLTRTSHPHYGTPIPHPFPLTQQSPEAFRNMPLSGNLIPGAVHRHTKSLFEEDLANAAARAASGGGRGLSWLPCARPPSVLTGSHDTDGEDAMATPEASLRGVSGGGAGGGVEGGFGPRDEEVWLCIGIIDILQVGSALRMHSHARKWCWHVHECRAG